MGLPRAQTLLDSYQGPRQFAMGGAGVALPDRARSSNFNPALPALSHPRNRTGLSLHPSWRDSHGGLLRFKDWNEPMAPGSPDDDAMWKSFLGLPAVYLPRLGYIGLDRMALASGWGSGTEEYVNHSLTISVADDFLDWDGREKDSAFAWTGGVSLKRYRTYFSWIDRSGGDRSYTAEGFAFDVGWAWRWMRIPYVDGLRATFGLAFLNLGPDYFVDEYAYDNYSEPLPQEYRFGGSLEYQPFSPVVLARRRWTPLRLIASQEFEKEFASYDEDGKARPFFSGFFRDFDKPPARYWREMRLNMGLELTLAEILYLRGGRGHSTFFWHGATWAYGYGVSSGPLFRRFYFGFDYARVLNMGAVRESGFYASPREYGFQMGYLF
jgi:hypothetical protein